VAFQRRSAIYTRIDAQLSDRTRFFAAAAVINAVLANLFDVISVICLPRSFTFLSEAGLALESANLQYAAECGRGKPSACTLDYALVCAEQRLLQCYLQAYQVRRPLQWGYVRRELNGLLNDRYAASLLSLLCKGSAGFSRVLREVRADLGTALDVAIESHRIRIGLKLIEHIRDDAECRHGGMVTGVLNRCADVPLQFPLERHSSHQRLTKTTRVR
jgi:hypothetical protein